MLKFLNIQCSITKSWILKPCNGYNGIKANILSVVTTDTQIYVATNNIPCYIIGPWNYNRDLPKEQTVNITFARNPLKNPGKKTRVGTGPVGMFLNGVWAFSPFDKQNRNAYTYEGLSFDNCLGHPDERGYYHNHVYPICLIQELGYYWNDHKKHSPLLGFMADSYPIYGPFGYSNPNSSSSLIIRLTPSYKDEEYLKDSGDLDRYNGRWTITPEYPQGTYVYYVTYDAKGVPLYPFIIGTHYYGTVISQSGSIVSTTTTTTPPVSTSSSRRLQPTLILCMLILFFRKAFSIR